MPAPLAFGGWNYVHAERQTMTRRGAALVDPMAVTSRGQASHEIRGAGETSEIAAHLLRWRAHSNAGAGQGAPTSERRHAHFSDDPFYMRFAVTDPAKCYPDLPKPARQVNFPDCGA